MSNWRGRKPVSSPYMQRSAGGVYRRDHVVVAERALGKPLPPGAPVHHYDGDGHNNANRNLVICQDEAYHMLLHRRQRVRDAGGNPNTDLFCSACRRPRPMELFAVRKTGVRAGAPIAYCQPCNRERRRVWGLAQRVGVEQTTAVGEF